MKTLKVLVEKVRTSQHSFLPVFALEYLEQCREANIRVTGLTMSKGETSKQLMELVQT
jgi:hypothetical protein